jgi:hypothetical protein
VAFHAASGTLVALTEDADGNGWLRLVDAASLQQLLCFKCVAVLCCAVHQWGVLQVPGMPLFTGCQLQHCQSMHLAP